MASAKPLARPKGQGRRSTWSRFVRSGSGMTGLLLILSITVGALFANYFASHDPLAFSPPTRLQGPSAEHWLGTDQFGRDTFSRILYGGRTSLAVAGLSVLFAGSLGTLLGMLAGYYRGWLELVIMRLTDILLAFPAILLAIALLAFFGGGFTNLVLAISIIYTGPFVRVARAAVLSVREELFVEANRALGAQDWRVLLLAVLPNAAAPLLIELSLRLAYAILAEAALSFLGLGTQPPAPSWGQMIADNRRFMALSAWASLAPGFAIMLAVLGFNLLGDGLRDVLDPRLRR